MLNVRECKKTAKARADRRLREQSKRAKCANIFGTGWGCASLVAKTLGREILLYVYFLCAFHKRATFQRTNDDRIFCDETKRHIQYTIYYTHNTCSTQFIGVLFCAKVRDWNSQHLNIVREEIYCCM